MLIAVEQAGFTKHHVLTFGHNSVDLSVFMENGSESLDKVRDFLIPLVPDNMQVARYVTPDENSGYLIYYMNFD